LISDSKEAVGIAQNPIFHKRMKHIDSRFHWIRKKVQVKRFVAELCPSSEQTADVLTKALPYPKHEKHVTGMGMSPV
jgi:hypothetical protein